MSDKKQNPLVIIGKRLWSANVRDYSQVVAFRVPLTRILLGLKVYDSGRLRFVWDAPWMAKKGHA